MERFNKIHQKEVLPQSESEWLKTGKFNEEIVKVGNNLIRCAYTNAGKESDIVVMAGGIPRDPNRRQNLPLINKLYGNLALKMLENNTSSLLYNQSATGGSTGIWEEETLMSRAGVLSGLTSVFHEKLSSDKISLIGMSAGAYIAVDSIQSLQEEGFAVSKLILMSPAAYPEEVENIPYGTEFSTAIRRHWDINNSPIFDKIEKYVRCGGMVLISFFENDHPPIPHSIQDKYREVVKKLSSEGFDIEIITIPKVAHNFRKINTDQDKNVVDNNSVRATTSFLVDFLNE
jgi:hypothetical protein